MRTLCVTLLTVVSLALNVSAITYQGTFIGTVTSVTTPFFGLDSVGDTFNGTYSYESATVNGLFTPASGNLQVMINLPDSTTLTEADDVAFNIYPQLSVAGGSVAFLDFGGPTGTLLHLHNFGLTWDVHISVNADQVNGTLAFSAPTAAVSSVPDGGSSVMLLGLACLSLLGVRRWLVAA